ncbi:cholecystokinin receptor-like [Mercenaria mercenaria]|uniref:cholecystokinin receptor-like n=1 Tax=Mercenaria mercenaria TaxID=6596 RepID=UPI00234EA573|nr:cholecystokinin receptor-like [Mercenaria mercenaria]
MNNTTTNKDALLEQLNNEKAVLMIPAFVYLVVLMLAGISGNVLICYYYGWKSKRSSDNMFILGVAMYDLILCTLSIPIEIVDIRFFYNFPYAGACKVMRFVNYFAAIGSVFTLIVIAIDRYRKICRPFKKQFRSKGAKIACGISIPFSLLLSWPAAIFYTSVPVDILTEDGIELQGIDCTTTREASYKMYVWIFNGFFLLAFIISAIILFVLYGLVGRAIYKHNKSQIKYTRPKTSYSHTVESHVTDNNSPKVNVNKRKTSRETEGVSEAHSTGSEIHTKIVPNKPKEHVSVKTMKFTTVMFVITTVFVVSFLPHLALSLWRAFQGTYEGESLSGAGLVAFQIGLRSYFLNSAINPLTYGLFNSKFRAFFYMTFCSYCKRLTDRRTVSSSSGTTAQFRMHSLTSH